MDIRTYVHTVQSDIKFTVSSDPCLGIEYVNSPTLKYLIIKTPVYTDHLCLHFKGAPTYVHTEVCTYVCAYLSSFWSDSEALHLSIAGENPVSLDAYSCVSKIMRSIVLTPMHRVAKAGELQLKVLQEAVEQYSGFISKLEEKVQCM